MATAPLKTINLSLKSAIASGSRGRPFTTGEENLIVSKCTAAANSGSTVSIADLRTAVAELNTKEGHEARTRAAVQNTVQRLIKKGMIKESSIAAGGKNRTQYTEEEDQVLVNALQAANGKNVELTHKDLHKVLMDSGKSPKARSLPSVRAHLDNLFAKAEKSEQKAANA